MICILKKKKQYHAIAVFSFVFFFFFNYFALVLCIFWQSLQYSWKFENGLHLTKMATYTLFWLIWNTWNSCNCEEMQQPVQKKKKKNPKKTKRFILKKKKKKKNVPERETIAKYLGILFPHSHHSQQIDIMAEINIYLNTKKKN